MVIGHLLADSESPDLDEKCFTSTSEQVSTIRKLCGADVESVPTERARS